MELLAIIISFLFGFLGADKTALSNLYSVIENDKFISLLPNFDTASSSAQLMEKNNCVAGINGGFYGSDSKPLGWFVTEGIQKQKLKTSDLFNGFVWQELNGRVQIASDIPETKVEWGFQTGPIIIQNGTLSPLRILNDQVARRMILAKDKSDRTIMLALYDPNSKLDGPTLTDLGSRVKEISDSQKLDIVTAVNLDGGSASAYHDRQNLTEVITVGSWLCVKS